MKPEKQYSCPLKTGFKYISTWIKPIYLHEAHFYLTKHLLKVLSFLKENRNDHSLKHSHDRMEPFEYLLIVLNIHPVF